MKLVDKQGKEWNSFWGSQSVADWGNPAVFTSLCEKDQEMSSDCGNRSNYAVFAPATHQAAHCLISTAVISHALQVMRENRVRYLTVRLGRGCRFERAV